MGEEEDKAEGTDYESVESEEDETGQEGMGIKYLPGDKKGLTERLRLLLAERQAGNNVSTTPEIVAILDALLQMGEINRVQYNSLCKTLKCQIFHLNTLFPVQVYWILQKNSWKKGQKLEKKSQSRQPRPILKGLLILLLGRKYKNKFSRVLPKVLKRRLSRRLRNLVFQ